MHSKTLVAIAQQRAQQQPDRVAYLFLAHGEQESGRLTYGELDWQARNVAAYLQQIAHAGDRALLLYPSGLEYIIGFFGCLYAGIIAVPAYPPRSKRVNTRLQAIRDNAEARLLLTSTATKEQVHHWLRDDSEAQLYHIIATDNIPMQAGEPRRFPELSASMLALLQYTSGSTATPKGVIISHQNLLSNGALMNQYMATSPESVMVSWLPLFHDMGLIGVVVHSLYVGFPCVLMPPAAFTQRPMRWLQAISAYKATICFAPNFAYELCVQTATPELLETLDLRSWRMAINGAEPVRVSTLDQFSMTFASCGLRHSTLTPGYGLAETTLAVSTSKPGIAPTYLYVDPDALAQHHIAVVPEHTAKKSTLVGCGPIYHEYAWAIVQPETQTRCAPDAIGEIWLRGPCIAEGYWQNEAATQQTFQAYLADTGEGPFLRTGDLGFVYNDELFITGRLKDLIIIDGRNHYPHDIEQLAAQAHPALRTGRSAAFSIEVDNAERLVLAIEVKRDTRPADVPAVEIKQAIRRAIVEAHEIDVYDVVLLRAASILMTTSGKIQRRACKQGYLEQTLSLWEIGAAQREPVSAGPVAQQHRSATSVEQTAPSQPFLQQAEIQALLIEDIATLLGLQPEQIDVRSTFESLGLTSRLAMRVVSNLESVLHHQLFPGLLYDYPTIAALSAYLNMHLLSPALSADTLPPLPSVASDDNERMWPMFPLSHGQQALWFLSQQAPDTVAYNTMLVLQLPTAVDQGALARALQALLLRHPALGTRFTQSGDRLVQTVQEPTSVQLVVMDSTGLPEAARQQQIATLLHQPFDLAVGVCRAILSTDGASARALVLVLHHIVSDFTTFMVLTRDLNALYQAEVTGTTPALPPLSSTYADYVRWEAEMLRVAGDRLRAYWHQQLSGELPVLQIPLDYARPPVQTFNGAAHPLTLDTNLTQQLKNLAQTQSVTLFSLLLATYQVLLYRLTGQDDLLVGTAPEAGRTRPEFAEVAGYFVNPVVLRSTIDPDAVPCFATFLSQVSQTVRGALVHQHYPFPLLVQELLPERHASRSPLFQTLFLLYERRNVVSDNAPLVPLALDGIGGQGSGQFDLSVFIADQGDTLQVMFDYNTDLFAAETIAHWSRHFVTLLAGIVADPQQAIDQLPLLTATERQHILVAWNDTAVDYPPATCLHHLFEQQAERTPDAIALVFDDDTLTYRELNQRSNQFAHHLQALGVGPEVLVGICVERSLDMVIGLLGILKAGGAYVPLDPTYPTERLAFMLEDSQAPVLLTQERLRHILPTHKAQVLCLDSDWPTIAQHATTNPTSSVSSENLAYVIYTSGSTGRPKGVMNEHRGICNRLLWMQDAYVLDDADSVMQKTPMSFDVSVWEFFWPLMAGARLVIARPGAHKDSAYLVELILQQHITTLHFVPSMLQIFVQEQGIDDCTNLRRVVCSGEALPMELQQRFYGRMKNTATVLYNLYGPTEAAVDVTAWTCQPDDERLSVSIGSPIANTQTYILDEQMQPVPIGVAGELYIGGVQVARGYLNLPALTAERFIANPFGNGRLYRTGDLARYRPDGNIEFLGRADFQVKVRGFRIELNEIEAVLSQHLQVQQAVVAARDDGAGNRLVAYVVGDALDPADLRSHLTAHLPDYMVPAAFVVLDALPLTPNGKIDRKALPAPDTDSLVREHYTAPRTTTEQTLVEIWQHVLGVEHIGIDDSFFALGGHSLLAVQVVNTLQHVTGHTLPITTLFQHPTIAALATQLDNGAPPNDLIARIPLGLAHVAPTSFPLSHGQQALWFMHQQAPQSAAYNTSIVLHVPENTDRAALQRALDALIVRHPALRTRFAQRGNRLVQTVQEPSSARLAIVDGSQQNGAERQQHIQTLSQQPFDLTETVFRVTLITDGREGSMVLLSLHHIISDFDSFAILIRDLNELYRAELLHAPALLPPLAYSSSDYVQWEAEMLRVAGNRLRAYWHQQLSGDLPALQLPTDYPRPPVQTFHGATHITTLDPDLTAQVKALAQTRGVTLFILLLAAYQVLLFRLTGQEDILVGTAPEAGRTHPEFADVVGYFVNPVVLRATIDPDAVPFFAPFLTWVSQTVQDALTHQHYPFSLLVQELLPKRDASRSPLFQTMFLLYHLQPSTNDDALLVPVPLDKTDEQGAGQFDLSVRIANQDDTLRVVFDYNTDLFAPETIARWARHFITLLQGIVADPEQPITHMPLLSESERQQLVVAWNDTAVDYPKEVCVHHLFERQAECTPEAVAVVFEDQQLTYSELNARSNQLAQYLWSLGVQPETPVALCVERSLALIMGILGIFKVGGTYVPLDPNAPSERLAFILADCQAPVLLTQERLRNTLPAHNAQVLCLDSDWPTIAEQPAAAPASTVQPESLAYIIYTSGSTGQPKGVLVEHRGLPNLVLEQLAVFDLRYGRRMLQFANNTFDASLSEIFPPLLAGATLDLGNATMVRVGPDLHTLLRQRAITTVKLPPSVLATLPLEPLPDLHTLIVAGEACPLELARQWGAFHRLVNVYGPTETTVCASLLVLDGQHLEHHTHYLSIGRPIANTQMYIIDAYCQPVPIGVVGEIAIAGVGVARGYLNRPELTAERFIPNPFGSGHLYKTGDLARYLPDGTIEFLGRTDFQVKVRGFRIELGEIEAVLRQHPAVQQAVVVARDDAMGVRLVAYVVCHVDSTSLRSYLTRQLPDYMVPAAFVFLDALPLTPNGKVDRQALPLPDATSLVRATYTAPRTEIERILVDLWQQVLGVAQVGCHDNFFGLGGDSILSIQVLNRIRAAGLRCPVRTLFQHQTIADLAQVVHMERAFVADTVAHPGAVPLTPIQQRFFERNVPDPHHFNQAMELDVAPDIDASRLEAALCHLLSRHAALRLRFAHTAQGWQQTLVDTAQSAPLLIIDLAHLALDEQLAAMQPTAIRVQADLNLEAGPLLRAVLWRRGAATPSRLLLVLHHLVVDWVSWSILIEDLSNAYRQLATGNAVQLPPQTTPFPTWARWLAEHGVAAVGEERAYWQALAQTDAAPLPRDYPAGKNTVMEASNITVRLSADKTHTLLHDAPAAYRMHINDVLLSALALTMAEWRGEPEVLLSLEGHGREDIAPTLDIIRTVGWFTSVFPVLLHVYPGDLVASLIAIKETLRAIPRHGIGYGILRYLDRDPFLLQSPPAEINFNYLGSADHIALSAPFLHMQIDKQRDAAQSPHHPRATLLDITGWVLHGQLHMSFAYSQAIHQAATIAHVAQRFIAILSDIIEHCLNVDGRYTPSDFPLCDVTQTTLEQVVAQVAQHHPHATAPRGGGIESIAPLTPTQQGMLLETLAHPHTGRFIEQLIWTWQGGVDLDAYIQAWNDVLAHHSGLRTLFVWEELPTPRQVVVARVSMPIEWYDWRDRTPDQQQTSLDAYLADERRRGFDLTRAPLMRLTLFQTDEQTMQVVWTSHHMVLDGWSRSLLFRDFLECYQARLRRDAPPPGAASPYDTYLTWVFQQDTQAAEQLWRAYLAGFTQPTPITPQRATQDAPAYDRQNYVLSAPTSTRLRNIAQTYHVTLNTLFQGAWALLLSRYSGTSDIVFGATVSGRPPEIAGIESMVGLCMSTIPVRVQVVREQSLIPWLHAHQHATTAMHAYAYCSSGQVQRWSAVPGALPLYESLLVFENYPLSVKPGDLDPQPPGPPVPPVPPVPPMEEVRSIGAQTQYPVTLLILPGKQLEIRVVYDTRYFTSQHIEIMLHHLDIVLDTIATLPDQPVATLLETIPQAEVPPVMAASARKHDAPSLLLPRTEKEHMLALLWQEVLGVEQVGIYDSFFDLGGHSLLAVSMVERMQETLGYTLPLATLLQHTTIAELTNVLDGTATSGNIFQSLVPIQPDGTQPPFFAIHPAAGNVLCYVSWAQGLGTLQPLYALQASGLDGRQLPPTTIEAMAAQYIAEIQTVQPCGPYRLGGWSLGGVIALEMAQQLQRQGAVVDVLVVIDSVLAHSDDPTTLVQGFLMTLHGRFLEIPAPMRMGLQDVTSDPNAVLQRLLEQENGAALLPPGMSKDRMYVLWNVYKALAGARARYTPTVYPGRITYLYAQEQSTLMPPSWTGWEPIAGGGIEYYPVPGDHFSMMSNPEHVRVVIERLSSCIARTTGHTTEV